jgi:RNA polymerase sigma-70 factor (ECF subfamily)
MHNSRTVGDPQTQQLDDRWAETLRRLRAFIAARVGDDEAAADITHDVLVRSIASGALERAENPIAWLYRSAHNAVIDHYRTRRRHQPIDARIDQWPEPGADDNRPTEATRDLARCLQPLVHELAPIYRDAVTRIDLDGQTHQRAADELGISVSGMKSRVQRGRRQLHETLTRCCAIQLDQTGSIAHYHPNNGPCDCSAPT